MLKDYRIYRINYRITQGQGSVPGSETLAAPKEWGMRKVRKEFLKYCLSRRDGSYKLGRSETLHIIPVLDET